MDELKDLKTTIQPIQSAVSELEASIRDLETEQQSVDQADSSLDIKISENIALLIIQFETLTDATNRITSITKRIAAITEGIDVEIQLAIAYSRYRPRPIITHPVNPVPAVPQTKEISGKQVFIVYGNV